MPFFIVLFFSFSMKILKQYGIQGFSIILAICIWVGFHRTGIYPDIGHFFENFNIALRRHLDL